MKSSAVFLLENAGWPALLLDGSTNLCRVNQAAVKLFGQALEGSTPLLSTIWSSENATNPQQCLAQWERSPASPVQVKLRTRGGGSTAFAISICSFSKDGEKFFLLQLPAEAAPSSPQQNEAAETGLALKQKLECALQLARTVALDFNNALTSILGHTSLILSRIEPNNPWRRSLIEVEKSAARAAEIANDLGMFSRQEKEPRGQAAGNLNLLTQRAVELFQHEASTGAVQWSLLLEPRPFTARFDEAKLQQALMRILENAVQAMGSAGRITVQTRNIELAEPSQDQNVHLAAGAYVSVEITDDGEGIPAEVLPRIFEPFFTTKGKAHRGLGLAWVYGVVTNHGGGVAVSSQPGTGTSVRVYLPAERHVLKENGTGAIDLRGTETILMVDDEDLLLTMGRTILSAYGYTVLTASSGKQAM